MRTIIADSSSLILLYKCGAAAVFLNNCCCIIPETVRYELTAGGHIGSDYFSQCIEKKTLTVKRLANDHEKVKKLHAGENGVIFIYEEGAGEFVLIDDGRGAAYCRDNGIPYINALLAVKILLFSGKISYEESSVMNQWLRKNGRYSRGIIEWAENADSDKLENFLF
jgi:predicted nucleic acid-binding protein